MKWKKGQSIHCNSSCLYNRCGSNDVYVLYSRVNFYYLQIKDCVEDDRGVLLVAVEKMRRVWKKEHLTKENQVHLWGPVSSLEWEELQRNGTVCFLVQSWISSKYKVNRVTLFYHRCIYLMLSNECTRWLKQNRERLFIDVPLCLCACLLDLWHHAVANIGNCTKGLEKKYSCVDIKTVIESKKKRVLKIQEDI